MPDPSGDFDALLALAREGDPQAWSELYHEVAPLVIGYLRAQRLPDPEDVAGEVMLQVVRDIGRFEGDQDRFRSWVVAIAHHRLIDSRRRSQRRPTTSTIEGQPDTTSALDDPEAETLATMALDRLEPALHRLTDDQRTVLLLRVIGDLSIAEVARVTGRRPGAVKQLQRRAAVAMRRALEKDPALREGRVDGSAYRALRDPTGPGDAPKAEWSR